MVENPKKHFQLARLGTQDFTTLSFGMLPKDCRMILQGGMVLLTMVSDTLINDLPPDPGLLYGVQGERALLLHMGNILTTHKSTTDQTKANQSCKEWCLGLKI